ncbi:MAG: DUF6131 family protein [Ktedonobacterales bacterium]
MKGLGGILAVLGIIGIVLALVNHFVKNFAGSGSHTSIIIAAVGVVLLVIGLAMFAMPRKASA